MGDGVGDGDGKDVGDTEGVGDGEGSEEGVGDTETVGLGAAFEATLRQINFFPDLTQMNDCPEALAFLPNFPQTAPDFGVAAIVGATKDRDNAAIRIEDASSFLLT